METLQRTLWAIAKWPLEALYRKGPRLVYLWEGLSEDNICYELTNVDALFWSSSVDSMVACEQLIRRKFEAFVVAVYGLLFVYVAYTLFCIKLYDYIFITRLNAIRGLSSNPEAVGHDELLRRIPRGSVLHLKDEDVVVALLKRRDSEPPPPSPVDKSK